MTDYHGKYASGTRLTQKQEDLATKLAVKLHQRRGVLERQVTVGELYTRLQEVLPGIAAQDIDRAVDEVLNPPPHPVVWFLLNRWYVLALGALWSLVFFSSDVERAAFISTFPTAILVAVHLYKTSEERLREQERSK